MKLHQYRSGRKLVSVLLLSGGFVLSSQTFADEIPEAAFELAEVSIDEAQEVKAERVAGDELIVAQKKLQQARDYNEEGETETATRLLKESKLHSEYAEVVGMNQNAVTALTEINETLDVLELELRR